MTKIQIVGKNGGRSTEIDLPEVCPKVLHEVVKWQLASRRRGTASTKTRAQVSRTGRKMYSQKGSGNARHGNRSVPTFVGGGVAFGPKPRDYSYTLPYKVRNLGLAMAISDRQNTNNLLAVDGFGLEDAKTKTFLKWAKDNSLDSNKKTLIVTDDENVLRSARNLSWVTVLPVVGINVYDILRHDYLIIDAVALEPASEEEDAE